MLFQSYEAQFDGRTLAWARLVHGRIFGAMPLHWARRRTWIEAWNGPKRVAFAPHKGGASIYFQGPGPVASYREWGGLCRTGRVTIHVATGADFEASLLTMVAAEHLRLPPIGASERAAEPDGRDRARS
jgi:hypothetical protein